MSDRTAAPAAGEDDAAYERRLSDEEAADNLRLIDWIADKIGLPKDEELSRENFAAWLASPAVGEWRDIASAPRDGTHIWLARVGAPASIVGYFSGYYGWMDTSGEVLDDRGIRDNRPTHWQDYVRPAPPQETKP